MCYPLPRDITTQPCSCNTHKLEVLETDKTTPEINHHHPKPTGYERSITLQDKAAPLSLLLPWAKALEGSTWMSELQPWTSSSKVVAIRQLPLSLSISAQKNCTYKCFPVPMPFSWSLVQARARPRQDNQDKDEDQDQDSSLTQHRFALSSPSPMNSTFIFVLLSKQTSRHLVGDATVTHEANWGHLSGCHRGSALPWGGQVPILLASSYCGARRPQKR